MSTARAHRLGLAVVTNMLAPHRLPLWEGLGRRIPGGVGIVSLVEAELNRNWGAWEGADLPVALLPGLSFRLGYERHVHLRMGAAAVLRRWRPRAVWLGGWDALAYWEARVAASRLGAKSFVGVGSTPVSAHQGRVQNALRTTFLRGVDGVFAYSAASASYAHALGVPISRVFAIGNPIAVDDVQRHGDAYARSAEGRAFRSTLSSPVFAFVGQLVQRKNPLMFLDAFEEVGRGSAIVIGDGPLRGAIETRAAASPSIRYLGPLQQPEIWRLLGVVDCLVLPSDAEIWGLVVNEALAAGAAAVVSNVSGAADLIEPGVNGVVVEPRTVDVARGMRAVAELDRETVRATARLGDVDRSIEIVLTALDVA